MKLPGVWAKRWGYPDNSGKAAGTENTRPAGFSHGWYNGPLAAGNSSGALFDSGKRMSSVEPRTNRREFLRGKSAGAALEHLVQGSLPAALAAWDADDCYLLRVGRRGMACQFEISLNAGQYSHAVDAAMQVLDLVEQVEAKLSFFRPESELNRLNRAAAAGPVPVDQELFEILQAALALARATGGAYDVTAAPLWEAWGFSRRTGTVPDRRQLAEALECVGHQWVELDAERSTVRFLKPGMSLNLGSIGKGYALDRCAERLAAAGIEHFLIHAGSSSAIARGKRGLGAAAGGAAGWSVGLPSPIRPDCRLGMLLIRNQGLGTSGAQAQSFWHQGRRYGHILDPRTGWPADRVLSATVVAPTAMLADALSTALFVMEPDEALRYCQAQSGLGVILLARAKRAGGLVARSSGLDEQSLVLLDSVKPH